MSLALPAAPDRAVADSAGGGDEGAAAGQAGGGRLIHYRPPVKELPQDLIDDEEAVEVWEAATEIKRLRGAGDRWVRGWRMRTVCRHHGGADLYIRAPDMDPQSMPNKHDAGATSIR